MGIATTSCLVHLLSMPDFHRYDPSVKTQQIARVLSRLFAGQELSSPLVPLKGTDHEVPRTSRTSTLMVAQPPPDPAELVQECKTDYCEPVR
jgi:hypothetical protein